MREEVSTSEDNGEGDYGYVDEDGEDGHESAATAPDEQFVIRMQRIGPMLDITGEMFLNTCKGGSPPEEG